MSILLKKLVESNRIKMERIEKEAGEAEDSFWINKSVMMVIGTVALCAAIADVGAAAVDYVEDNANPNCTRSILSLVLIIISTALFVLKEIFTKCKKNAKKKRDEIEKQRLAQEKQVAELVQAYIESCRSLKKGNHTGASSRGIDLGFAHFPALREGRPVFLCWKAGEPGIAHWHGTDEMFADRRSL